MDFLVRFYQDTSLVGVAVGIASSEARLKICAITAGIKNYIIQLSRKRGRNMVK